MTCALDQLLADLRREMAEMTGAADSFERQAAQLRQDAMMLAARVQGIEEAMAGLALATSTGRPQPRRRRNIQALVREIVEVEGRDVMAWEVAQRLGCKVKQVQVALRRINGPQA